ncbi:ribosome silencing factor [Denitromonas iodatirespirans]|uniref:Ribosomal silencing factor RsfS n=1 Tax=Denitromonas iodatirespirans TaxID=2795389 RepID=A0A944DCF3_DENI1|nr:ribosome silencing factor [Denitromonas iodatirespirans]MBT0961817.1 ribosome silencing factor [Denitromonas iodatirespirans]
MELDQLQQTVVNALEDVKATNIEVIDTTKLTALFDRMIIASGNSGRQTRALARNVQDEVKKAGGAVNSVEGEDGGDWVLVDLGTIIVHIMQPAVRAYYNLEELWKATPSHPKPSKP